VERENKAGEDVLSEHKLSLLAVKGLETHRQQDDAFCITTFQKCRTLMCSCLSEVEDTKPWIFFSCAS